MLACLCTCMLVCLHSCVLAFLCLACLCACVLLCTWSKLQQKKNLKERRQKAAAKRAKARAKRPIGTKGNFKATPFKDEKAAAVRVWSAGKMYMTRIRTNSTDYLGKRLKKMP